MIMATKAHTPERFECHDIFTHADMVQALYGRYIVPLAVLIRATLEFASRGGNLQGK